ncbi:hypothetical protein H1D24_33040 [Streptomyces sp. PSKA28]|uniref:Uncharacterized protein n=1 Tax=Streptomyces himalayensis subsp. himalayensis TaxID=2756131 RepID=A0A7W0DSH9_9ACTN|nr:hypothetical protein [Streptomyces himalayensis subsp. himalayensis]
MQIFTSADSTEPSWRADAAASGHVSALRERLDAGREASQSVRDSVDLRGALLLDPVTAAVDDVGGASLDAVSCTLADLFWARIEALAPGIDSLGLRPAVSRAWKEDLNVK